MRVRPLSSLLGAALVVTGLTVMVAPQASAAPAPSVRLFLHGTSEFYAEDSLMDPPAWAGQAPAGVFADTTPPTGTSAKLGTAAELTGSPGLPVTPTFLLPVKGTLTSACIDIFVAPEGPGGTYPISVAFGEGNPSESGVWVYPPDIPVEGTGLVRVTTLIKLEAPFELVEGATVFFWLGGAFHEDPGTQPYTLNYDSVAEPSNVTLNPTGPCTPASGSAPAPAPAPSAAPSASAEPSASASEEPSASASAEPSASASEEPSASAGPNPGSCGGASGDPSASADPSASGDPSADPSASASPTGGGGGLPTPGTKTTSRSAALAQEPARDATSCRVTNITLATNATQITAGNGPVLSGVARDDRGDAVEGATITIYTKGYGEKGYTAAATVKTDSAGQYRIAIRPMKQTAIGANVGGAKSPVIGIRVSTRVNIAQPAPGTVGTQQTFTGNLLPGFARVAVGVAYLLNGRHTVLTQANTDGSGRYSIPARLPRGTHTFVVFTSAHQGTDRGSRSVRLTVR